ncbi:hypothetical protein [Neptuniibacter sp.]|uniref:hypothetical protein n=1 Tax=Neptuniibacter sp. TaxID=1962643 RepID=UPI0026325EAF|nr:hypothetical protein [Neptuniibacter sp.]MCP4595395.1 hypothetical protein [Neptuniibacter sp.]
MKLKTLSELEHSLGGRPRTAKTKVRMSFYLTQEEAELLRIASENEARPVSQQVRLLIRKFIEQQQ